MSTPLAYNLNSLSLLRFSPGLGFGVHLRSGCCWRFLFLLTEWFSSQGKDPPITSLKFYQGRGKTSSVKQRMIRLRCTGGCYYCFSTITETLGLGRTPGHHLASSPFYWVAPSQQLPSLSVPVDGLPAHLPPTASCVPLGMQEEPGAPCAWGSLPL